MNLLKEINLRMYAMMLVFVMMFTLIPSMGVRAYEPITFEDIEQKINEVTEACVVIQDPDDNYHAKTDENWAYLKSLELDPSYDIDEEEEDGRISWYIMTKTEGAWTVYLFGSHMWDGDTCLICGLAKSNPPQNPPTPCQTPSTTKEEKPSEPPTPAEELRAAEEEALPLAIVEKDKTQVTKEEVGIVPDKAYNLSAYVTTKGFVSALDKIAKANPQEKSVSIFTGKPFTFNKGIVEAINKGGKEVVYYFNHEGHLYSVTVPANVDPTSILEKGGHAGPLYVGKVLGTTRLVK